METPRTDTPRSPLGALAAIVFLRVAGVSLLLPGFIRHAQTLGGDVGQAGLAFAAYPLAMAFLLYPLGVLSDRIGRRAVLAGGLAVSAAGALVAAVAPTVLLLGAGRFVQGLGAINGVAVAVAGETGAPDRRARRMALLGASAGAGFAAGLVLGAVLDPFLGVPGLLVLQALASAALVPVVLRNVPKEAPERPAPSPARASGRRVLALAIGAFATNLALMGLLFLSPLLVTGAPYWLAVGLMVAPSGAGIFLAARLADQGHARAVGVAGAVALGAAPLAFVLGAPLVGLILAGVVFFLGHSALSSLLPALAAAVADPARRGAAQGLQSTLQYLGSAVGTAVAAALWPAVGPLAALFVAAGLVAAAAVGVAATRARAPT